jgi:hypothetical protein
MRLYMLSILALFINITVACQGQEQKKGTKKSKEIYVSSPIPYEVVGHKKIFNLSDSLSKGRKGHAGLEVFLSNEGKVEGFNLTFLKLTDASIDSIRHYNYSQQILEREEYPKKVQEFLPIFEEYISGLKFVRKENISLSKESEYMLNIPLKLQ